MGLSIKVNPFFLNEATIYVSGGFMDNDVIERVKALAADYLSQNSMELVDIIYRREQPGMVLRLLVDTPYGVTVKECTDLNHYLSEALNGENIIEGHFVLEVSSPGLDRPIVTDRDFERAVGNDLTVTTYEPIDGGRAHEGKLIGLEKENIVIESEGISIVVPRVKIAKAVLKIDF